MHAPLPALVRWGAVLLLVPATVVACFLSVALFSSRCPGIAGPEAPAARDSLQGRLCGATATDTNPGDILIVAVTLVLGAFLTALVLRARRWLALLTASALCVVTPVAVLLVALSLPDGCASGTQEADGGCNPVAEE